MLPCHPIPILLLAAGLFQSAAAVTLHSSGAGMPLEDGQAWSSPNWQTKDALAAAKSAATNGLTASLRAVLLHNRDALLAELESLTARQDLSWPQREAALLQFVRSLDGLRRDQVPHAAMAFLAQWQPHTLVPHEEMSTLGTPLFNIAAGAHGVQNRWRREEAQQRAVARLRTDPKGFLADWSQATDPATRAGLLDALNVSGRGALQKVLTAARASSSANPQLALVAGHAAIALRDADAISALIVQGAGSQARALLQASGDLLSVDQLVNMLVALRRDAGAPAVALAIGIWSHKLAGHRGAELLLLDWLSDAELGSCAALALSVAPTAKTLVQLQTQANAANTTLRAQRARLALRRDHISEIPQ
ncbi:MAG: hypothetical protein SGI99_18465 [Pseudomonadota bacterium]|nr:hypothetical protein [Pseudomonadota bacterium]